MNRRTAATALLAAALATPARAARSLRLVAEQRGVRTTLELQIDGARVSGQATEQAMQLSLDGRLDAGRLELVLRDPASGSPVARLAGALQGDRFDATLSPLQPGAAATRTVFTRDTGADVTGSAGAPDPRLVGRWVRQSTLSSSGGAGGSAAFSTERTLELGADGQVRQWVRSAGGGALWSAGSARTLEFSGRWQLRQGELWVQREGDTQYRYAAHARLAGAYLVTETQAGRQIWQR